MPHKESKKLVTEPLAWLTGGIVSVVSVALSIGIDPASSLLVVIDVFVANAMSIFTALSITGFTIAPNVPWLPTGAIQTVAIGFGALIVLLIADQVWDNLKRRVSDD